MPDDPQPQNQPIPNPPSTAETTVAPGQTARMLALQSADATARLAAQSSVQGISNVEASQSPIVQAIDRLGDIVGVLCVTYLSHTGKISGLEAVGSIVTILGSLQLLRRPAKSSGPRGTGVLGLAVGMALTGIEYAIKQSSNGSG